MKSRKVTLRYGIVNKHQDIAVILVDGTSLRHKQLIFDPVCGSDTHSNVYLNKCAAIFDVWYLKIEHLDVERLSSHVIMDLEASHGWSHGNITLVQIMDYARRKILLLQYDARSTADKHALTRMIAHLRVIYVWDAKMDGANLHIQTGIDITEKLYDVSLFAIGCRHLSLEHHMMNFMYRFHTVDAHGYPAALTPLCKRNVDFSMFASSPMSSSNRSRSDVYWEYAINDVLALWMTLFDMFRNAEEHPGIMQTAHSHMQRLARLRMRDQGNHDVRRVKYSTIRRLLTVA